MTLQLHDNGLEGRSWFRRAARSAIRYAPNPYYQAARFAYRNRPRFLREDMELAQEAYEPILSQIYETPTYVQFMNETGLSEDDPQLAGKFGTWLKTKAVPKLQKIQSSLAPVIGLLPGGGVVNTAFDILKRPTGSPEPEVQVLPNPVATTPIMPSPAALSPAFAPSPMPSFAPAPPMYYGGAPEPAGGGGFLPPWLDWKVGALIAAGGLGLYFLLRKK
jgi:hypothetical protein